MQSRQHPRDASVPPAATHTSPGPLPTPQWPHTRASRVSYLPVTAVLGQVEHWQRSCHHQAQPLHKHRMVSHGPSLPQGQGWGGQQRGLMGHVLCRTLGPVSPSTCTLEFCGTPGSVSPAAPWGCSPHPHPPVWDPGLGIPTCPGAVWDPWAGGSLPGHPGRHWSTGPAWLGSQPGPWVCPAHPGTPAGTQDTGKDNMGTRCLLAPAC